MDCPLLISFINKVLNLRNNYYYNHTTVFVCNQLWINNFCKQQCLLSNLGEVIGKACSVACDMHMRDSTGTAYILETDRQQPVLELTVV